MPVVMYKKIGETPLECLNRLRLEQPQYGRRTGTAGSDAVGVPMTYAGRLDPMAEGVLLVLVGDECKRREEFLDLEKEYICEILWGFETDTYDILGKVKWIGAKKFLMGEINSADLCGCLFMEQKLPEILQKFIGKSQQKFPPYSSKPVGGKPLHEWARADRLDEIELPSKEVEIKEMELVSSSCVSSAEIKEKILSRLALVHGDFRQAEIIALWQKTFEKLDAKLDAEKAETSHEKILVSTVRIVCSSGTYVRSIVQELGQGLGTGAIVLSLVRPRVGSYK